MQRSLNKKYSKQVYPELVSTPRSEFKRKSPEGQGNTSRLLTHSSTLQENESIQERSGRISTVRYLPRRETNLSRNGEATISNETAKAVWIAKTFKKKECIRFVPAPPKPSKPGNFCCCGRLAENHIQLYDEDNGAPPPYEATQQPDRPWNPKNTSDVRKYPTDAFGKITFVSEAEGTKKPAKYVRISDDTPLNDILELFHLWKLPRPNLVISITGGAKNYKLGEQHAEVFSRGLVNAAQTTPTWLITGGTNTGIVKAVGDAVHEGQRMQWVGGRAKRTVRCIGIAPWGYIEDHDSLVSEDGMGLYPATYKVNPVIKRGHPVSLNPEHTHFILVDNGTDLKFGVELKLRSELEKKIAAPIDPEDPENDGLGVPVAMLLIEGGVDSINTVKGAVSRGIPAVICEGTGRAADILAFAYNNAVKKDNGVHLKRDKMKILKEKLLLAYGNEQSHEKLNAVCKDIQEIVGYTNLLTVFDMDKGDKAEMDLAILTALLKGSGVNWKHQIELALSWNCIGVARERIFTEDITWKGEELHDFMTVALIDNKVEFVKLFLENRVIMQEYLTVARLRKLYNSAPPDSNFRTLMGMLPACKQEGPFSLRDIGRLIGKMMGGHYEPLYLRDKKFKGTARDLRALAALSMNLTGMSAVHMAYQEYQKNYQDASQDSEGKDDEDVEEPMGSFELTNPAMNFSKPFRELFLWAILMGRLEMAEFLWELSDEAISSAVVAVKIFKSMSESISDQEDKKTYDENARKFEHLAVSVLEECYDTDEVLAEMLIERRHSTWGGRNILNVAAEANCKEFISHACCQSLLNKIWKGGIKSSPLQVVLAGLIPCLMLKLKYKEKNKDEELTPCEKISVYINAPVSKFWGGSFLYIIFLLWYSYAILFNFNATPNLGDCLLFGWICTLIVEEFRQSIIPEENETVLQKIWKWAKSWWNIMDLVSILIAIIGFILRWFEPTLEVARSLYAINCAIFILRILRMFSLNSTLGPKLIMIGKMLKEMALFLVLLLVFMIAYGVSAQALLYPGRRRLYWGIIRDIVYMPYFQIYGELFLEELDPIYGSGDDPICDASNIDPTQSCSGGHPVVPFLLAIYLIVGNVLLLNLLIAIFSYVFEEVQTNSLQVWKYEVYDLVMEFEDRPPLAPPLIILSHIFLILRWVYHKVKNKSVVEDTATSYSAKHLEILWLLEKDCAASYRKKKLQEEEASVEERLSKIESRLDVIAKCAETLLQKEEARQEGKAKAKKDKQKDDNKRKDSENDPDQGNPAQPGPSSQGSAERPGPSNHGDGGIGGAESGKDEERGTRSKLFQRRDDYLPPVRSQRDARQDEGNSFDEVDGDDRAIESVEEATKITAEEYTDDGANSPRKKRGKKKKKPKSKPSKDQELPLLETRSLVPLWEEFRAPSPKSVLKSNGDDRESNGIRDTRKVRFDEYDEMRLLPQDDDNSEDNGEQAKKKKKKKKKKDERHKESFMLENVRGWKQKEQIAVPIDNDDDDDDDTSGFEKTKSRFRGEYDLYHASDETD
ncbi:transient receptor potential cation channel subfamily M member-like 2 [Ptychodera flava]|uniref:transient receptor potential cation channel subfamily M member-like 2 n=1 Tax=Ptychodera flava TaxID=63121 RepID=UPI00396A3ABF